MNTSRLGRFRRHLGEAGLDGAVVRRPANVFYLSGYVARLELPSFVVVGPERTALVAPGDAGASAKRLDLDWLGFGYPTPGTTLDHVPDVVEGSAAALAQALDVVGLGGRRVGIEIGDLSAWHAAVLSERAQSAPLAEHLAAMRRIKDAEELRQIELAVDANDVGFRAAKEAIAEGVTELAVMDAVVAAMERATGEGIDVLDPTNAFVSGPRTLLAAAPATSRRLERGDLMILDLNPYVGAYKGDTTRTFCVGEPTAVQRKAHDALVAGLEAAEQVGRPGRSGRDLFAALVAPIEAAGLGSLKYHGGHGIGLEHTERPFIIPSEDMLLEEGMVLALEPGVYLPELGGLRVEDNFVVTAGGLRALSHYPRELIRCD